MCYVNDKKTKLCYININAININDYFTKCVDKIQNEYIF